MAATFSDTSSHRNVVMWLSCILLTIMEAPKNRIEPQSLSHRQPELIAPTAEQFTALNDQA